MREILFRGQKKCPSWHADFQDWFYGDLVTSEGSYQINTPNGEIAEVFAETIGQYTGLTDKNGNRIFEGDIVAFEDAAADFEGYHDDVFTNRGVFKFSDGQFYAAADYATVTTEDLIYKGVFDGEVIGNIYDNPELMEV